MRPSRSLAVPAPTGALVKRSSGLPPQAVKPCAAATRAQQARAAIPGPGENVRILRIFAVSSVGRRSAARDERDETLAVGVVESSEGMARSLRLTAMPEDRLRDAAGAAVVKQRALAGRGVAETPERRGAPLAPGRARLVAAVGESGAQVVQQEVRVGLSRGTVGLRRSE